MFRRITQFTLAAILVLTHHFVPVSIALAQNPPVGPQRIAPDPATGSSGAVAAGDIRLLYTEQILPPAPDADGPPALNAQLDSVFEKLQSLLKLEKAGLEQIVKLNIYVASDELGENVRRDLAKRFRDKPLPAVSYVSGRLPRPDALVALDAIAAIEGASNGPRYLAVEQGDPVHRAALSTQPAAPRVYISGQAEAISGQAEAAADMAEATTKTMQSLEKTLKHLGLNRGDVLQIKSFLGPMAKVAEARGAIEEFFKGATVPPLVFVEWSSSLPIEIELVATSPRRKGKQDPIEFITPPGMTASPVFCRVTRVNAPETIFISGLYGPEGVEPVQEVDEIFGTLRKLLMATHSDLQHLAKATYYVTRDDASNRLNEIRPKLYDPKRPPAASKAMVTGTGQPRRTITLDMIAVRKPADGK